MYVETLACQNFRNYEHLDIRFGDHINILYGENAQGKTNILEMIYLAATTRSHRGAKDRDMIRFGEEEAHIRLNLKKRDVGHRIDVHIRKKGPKGIAVDGIPIRRSAELFGLLNIVLFSPEDLSIVKRGPAERRHFMDAEICSLSRIYYSNLQKYNRILDQRNNLLKQISFRPDLESTLDVWDVQLIETGKSIIRERTNFIQMMNEIVSDIHRDLTEEKEHLELRYEPNADAEHFEEELQRKKSLDLKMMSTQTGPQRDDFAILINGMDARVYGSQGQQRTAALSMKIAEIRLVRKIINDDPVLLLDDVMSELDAGRREALLRRIRDIQTIITCTGYDDFIRTRTNADKIYKISGGRLV